MSNNRLKQECKAMGIWSKRFLPKLEQVSPLDHNDPPIRKSMFMEFRASMTLLVQSLLAKDNREELDLANLTRVMGTT